MLGNEWHIISYCDIFIEEILSLWRFCMLFSITYSAALSLALFLAGVPDPQAKAASNSKTTISGKTMNSDDAFAKKAAEGGIAEVKFGQLAEDKGNSPTVKDFGKRMVADHTKANEQLEKEAAKEKVDLPTKMTNRDQMAYDRLSKLSGASFDRVYARDMVRDHRADIVEFQAESKSGHKDWTKTFATQTLPTLQEHLKQAEEMLHAVESSKTHKS
jgi:putative membrane protein